MINLSLNVDDHSYHMIHRIKQLNVLTLPNFQTFLILLINLYNRTSIISFYSKHSFKKILKNFDPNVEIIKIKLTNLKSCSSFLEGLKTTSYLLILTPYSIVLYHIFMQKKIREIHMDTNLISHKYSFDDFLVLPIENDENLFEISNQEIKTQFKSIPKFLIMTSSNDCTIKIWNLLNGTLLKIFNSVALNKHFLYFPMNFSKKYDTNHNNNTFNDFENELNENNAIELSKNSDSLEHIKKNTDKIITNDKDKNIKSMLNIMNVKVVNENFKSLKNISKFVEEFKSIENIHNCMSISKDSDKIMIKKEKFQKSYLISVFNTKIFNQTQIEINVWDWRKGELHKTLKNGVNFRSILQIDYHIFQSKETFLIIGGVENNFNYKIVVFDWITENNIRKIENLSCFSYFLWKNSEIFSKNENFEVKNKDKIITFNKNNVISWSLESGKHKILMECTEDFFNFTSGVVIKTSNSKKILIAKGLSIFNV